MKPKFIISLILILVSITACNQLPNTSCGCWQNSIKKMEKLDKKDSIIKLFNPNRKSHYQHDLAILYASAKRLDDYVRHCREIYLKQGLCKEKSNSIMSLWDYGGLITPENEEGFRRKYSGDWDKDSVRYGPRGAVTIDDIKERVYFQLWYKMELDNLPLTEREQVFYDSMFTKYNKGFLNDSILNDSTFFPRMWHEYEIEGLKDTGLQNYLKREQYH